MRKIIYISLLMLLAGATGWAQKQKNGTVDGVKDIDPEVYDYYKKLTGSPRERVILLQADTLYEMARATNDPRTMVASFCFKQDYYNANEKFDSAEMVRRHIQKISKELGQEKYYYYSWGNSIKYLINHSLYNQALTELKAMEKDIHKDIDCERTYYELMENLFRFERNYRQAIRYGRRLVDFVENHDETNAFNQHRNYMLIVEDYIALEQYDSALAVVREAYASEKASGRDAQRAMIACREVQIYVKKGDFAKARAALRQVEELTPEGQNRGEVVEAHIYYMATGNYQLALNWIERYESLTGLTSMLMREKITCLSRLPGREGEAARLAIRYADQRDSAHASQQNSAIAEFAAAMDVKRLENNLSTQKVLHNRMIAAVLGVFAAASVGFSAYTANTLRRLRKKSQEVIEVTEKKEAVESEIHVAANIQQRMLLRQFPNDPRMEMSADLESALQVSGDLYDYLVDQDKVHFIVGDVSGKGVAASLFMSVASCSFRTFAHQSRNAAHTMQRINTVSCANNPQNTFITALVGTLDLNTGEMTLCNAGHPRPLLLARDAHGRYHAEEVELEVNLPLGLQPDSEYTGHRLRLRRGDKLFIYTDGVSERENAALDHYGEERLRQTLLEAAEQPADQLIAHCRASLAAHADGAPQNDDITMMAITFTGPKN